MEKKLLKFKSNVSLLSEISIYTYEAENLWPEIMLAKKGKQRTSYFAQRGQCNTYSLF
jgi:hypothetical protein